MNYHIKRWITGLLATPLLFAFVFYSSEKVFSVFVILVIQIAVWEYITLVFDQNGFAWEKGEVFIFSLIISLSFYLKDISYTTPVITLSLFLTFLLFLLEIGEEKVDV
ncbi:MAG: hypothetical protein L7F78_10150, partial [Syntrophales bacterium LBB04]|nr:hypothetical protein [Syntrophales bacterium LBB04]